MTREAELLIDMWDTLHRECHKVVTEENYDVIKKAIKALEQEPKTGHWKLKQRGKYIDICCSKCGFQRVKGYAYNYTVDQISEQDTKDFFSNSNMNFCENCGTRMVEPQESEGEK